MESYGAPCCKSQRGATTPGEAPKQKHGKSNSMRSLILPRSSQRCCSSKAIGSVSLFSGWGLGEDCLLQKLSSCPPVSAAAMADSRMTETRVLGFPFLLNCWNLELACLSISFFLQTRSHSKENIKTKVNLI